MINLSLEFDFGVTLVGHPRHHWRDRVRPRHGAVVVAAAGNEGVEQLAYPAADPDVDLGRRHDERSVPGRLLQRRPKLDLVAPGGGDDAICPDGSGLPSKLGADLPSIYQLTLVDAPHSWSRFGYPGSIYGTSMAARRTSRRPRRS